MCAKSYQTISKSIDELSPVEILSLVRKGDRQKIKVLLIDGIQVKKIWSPQDAADLLDVDLSTVYRLMNG